MSRWDRHPTEVAHAEEASRHIPDEPISSSMVVLGRNTTPHVYAGKDGRMWIRCVGRGVTVELTMTEGQLRSIVGQGERVMHALDLRGGAA